MASGRVRELALLFLKLGCIGFGGPAAHIALMHDEVVRRRGWLEEQHFLDLVGATNLVPGPNSTELAIHIGFVRVGWRGLFTAGACFIGPSALLVGGLAWAYLQYGQTPAGTGLRYGILPVVIAIIGYALVPLLHTAARSRWLVLLSAAALAAYLLGVNELVILAGGAVLAALATWRPRQRPPGLAALVPMAGAPYFTDPSWAQLARLFVTMLKIGSVLYGSGYVLFAFLRGDFVNRLGWLTEQQLLDAVAAGQLTPGPLFTSATFVGYLVAGVPGAVLATIAIFLPAFAFAAFLGRIVTWLRARRWASAALDGVNATALALMAGVALQLGRAALVDPLAIALAVVALAVLWRFRLNSAWLILAGASIGLAHAALA